jgi:hypothetical protein
LELELEFRYWGYKNKPAGGTVSIDKKGADCELTFAGVAIDNIVGGHTETDKELVIFLKNGGNFIIPKEKVEVKPTPETKDFATKDYVVDLFKYNEITFSGKSELSMNMRDGTKCVVKEPTSTFHLDGAGPVPVIANQYSINGHQVSELTMFQILELVAGKKTANNETLTFKNKGDAMHAQIFGKVTANECKLTDVTTNVDELLGGHLEDADNYLVSVKLPDGTTTTLYIPKRAEVSINN